MVKLIVSGIAAVIVLVLAVVFWPLVGVQAGHMGVVVLFGQVQEVPLSPGLHVVNPLAHVIDFDVKQYAYKVDGEVGTKDLQSVHGQVVVNYRAAPATVGKLYAQFGPGYQDKIIAPAVQDRMKAVTPHFNAEELVTKRSQVGLSIKEAVVTAIRERSGGMVIVDDVVVTNFDFAKSFTKAIEDKQVAEQLAMKAKNDLVRITVEAEQKVATAKAEAESFRLKSIQITPQMLQMEAIQKWDGKLPTYLGAGAPVPFLAVK